MSYSTHDLVVIALIMTLGSFLQGALGFASGLVGVPLLVLSGFSLLEATVINFISTIVQNTAGAVQLRAHIDWSEVALPQRSAPSDSPSAWSPSIRRSISISGVVKQSSACFCSPASCCSSFCASTRATKPRSHGPPPRASPPDS